MIEFKITDQSVRNKLNKLKLTLKQKTELLNRIAINIQKGLDGNFVNQQDSRKKKWVPLKADRLRKGKKKRSVKLLQDTGEGRRMDFQVNSQGAKVGTTKDYMQYHNTGTKRGLPKREWAYVSDDAEKKVITAMNRYLDKL